MPKRGEHQIWNHGEDNAVEIFSSTPHESIIQVCVVKSVHPEVCLDSNPGLRSDIRRKCLWSNLTDRSDQRDTPPWWEAPGRKHDRFPRRNSRKLLEEGGSEPLKFLITQPLPPFSGFSGLQTTRIVLRSVEMADNSDRLANSEVGKRHNLTGVRPSQAGHPGGFELWTLYLSLECSLDRS